jgi:PAS domain S-box-containing protein
MQIITDYLGQEISRKLAAQELLKFKTISETATYATAIIDSEGKIMYSNRTMCTMHGYSPDELIGYNISALAHSDAAPQAKAMWQHLTNTGSIATTEMWHAKKDGTLLPILINAGSLYDHVKNTACYSITIVDISPIKELERIIWESETRFRTLASLAPAGIFLTDSNGTIQYHNERLSEIMRITPNDIHYDIISAMIYPDDRENVIKNRDEAIADKSEWSGAYRMNFPNGDLIWIYEIAKPLSDDKRFFHGYIGILLDISETKNAEEALRKSEERFRTLVENAPDAIIVETDGKIVYLNSAALSLLDTKNQAELLETYLIDSVRADYHPIISSYQQILDNNRRSIPLTEAVFLTANGMQVNVELSAVPFIYGDSPGSLFFVRDITRRRTTEDRLEWESLINHAFALLSEQIITQDISIHDLAFIILKYARLLTDSEIGYVSEIDHITGENKCHCVDGRNDETCGKDLEPNKFHMNIEPDGSYSHLWGFSLNAREGFFSNDPSSHKASAGLSNSHMHIKAFLSMPAIFANELLGQIFLANPRRPYNNDHLGIIKRLAELYAIAIHRIRTEDHLRMSLSEKELLLKEVHHRVKNNMQVIVSMLSLQQMKIEDATFKKVFLDSQNRIYTMALIHEKLYRSMDFAHIDIGQYITDLSHHLYDAYNADPAQLKLDIHAADIKLSIDVALPLAQIVNELLSNSLKHAFPNNMRGEISIHLSLKEGDEYQLAVHDNGVGIPDDYEDRKTRSLGMEIVQALVKQLEGSLRLDRNCGTSFIISFRIR